MALGGDGFAVSTAAATGVSARLREAGAEVAACLDDLARAAAPDPAAAHRRPRRRPADIVRGAYDVAGSVVPLVGGCAGDDLAMADTFQLHGARGPARRGRRRSRSAPTPRSASASSTAGAASATPCWSPAARATASTRSTTGPRSTSTSSASTCPSPPAPTPPRSPASPARTRSASAAAAARTTCASSARPTSRTARSAASPRCRRARSRGSWRATPTPSCGATDAACRAALEPLDGEQPLGVLAFDCIARRGVLGETGIVDEVERIGEICGGSPVAGFYTYGEIARTRGISGFHNQTLVVLALG